VINENEITYTNYDPLFLALDRNAPEDTADYGPMGNPDYERGPDETRCWNCDQLALDHSPGRWSFYGVCPTYSY